MTDRELIRKSLLVNARLLRRTAARKSYYGPEWKGYRESLRMLAKRCEALAGEMS